METNHIPHSNTALDEQQAAARFSRVSAAITHTKHLAENLKDQSRRIIGVAALVGSLAFTATAAADTDTYKVRSGDSLSQIADDHHMSLQQLYKRNPEQRNTPNIVNPGEILTLTDKNHAPKRYTIKDGDSLIGIADSHHTTLGKVLKLNPQFRENPGQIKPGQKVTLKKSPQAKQMSTSKIVAKPKKIVPAVADKPIIAKVQPNKFDFRQAIPELQPETIQPVVQPKAKVESEKPAEATSPATPPAAPETTPLAPLAAPEQLLKADEIQEISRQRHALGLSTVVIKGGDGNFRIQDAQTPSDPASQTPGETTTPPPAAPEAVNLTSSTQVEAVSDVMAALGAATDKIIAATAEPTEQEKIDAKVEARANFTEDVVKALKAEYKKNGNKFLETEGENNGPQVEKYTGGETGPGAPWCAWFVSYIYKQAGLTFEQPYARADGSISLVSNFSAWFKQNGLHFTADSQEHTPRPGDAIMYGSQHMGMVAKVDGDWIETIEGNTGGNGSYNANGETVGRKAFNYKTYGYGGNIEFGRVMTPPAKYRVSP